MFQLYKRRRQMCVGYCGDAVSKFFRDARFHKDGFLFCGLHELICLFSFVLIFHATITVHANCISFGILTNQFILGNNEAEHALVETKTTTFSL